MAETLTPAGSAAGDSPTAGRPTGPAPVGPAPRNPVLVWGGVVAAAGALAGLALTATEEGPVLCPFRRCTGGYCPGCGLTRAGGELLRGDLAASWRQHPFLLLLVAQAGLAATVMAFATLARRRRSTPTPATSPGPGSWSMPSRYQHLLIGVNVVMLLGIWLIRLATGAIPAPFS